MDIYKFICILHLLIICGGPLLTDAQPPWRRGYGRRGRGRIGRGRAIYPPRYPIPGGLYLETGGLYPETGGLYPETGGLYPETGGLYPAIGGLYPESGGLYPESGGIYPGVDPALYPVGVPSGPVLHPGKVGRPIVPGGVPMHPIDPIGPVDTVGPVVPVPVPGPTAVKDTSSNTNMNINISNNNKNVHDQAGSNNVRVSQGRDRNVCHQECGMHGACMPPSMCLPNPDCSTGYGCQ